MSEERNLKIWGLVEKTDPSATKTAKLGGREQTSISGYYMIKRATEIFGMPGIGWGWEVMEERWDEGKPLITKLNDKEERCGNAITHTLKLKLWFMQDGQRGEIIQYGHTQAVYSSSYGISDDGEAPKKSLMDAIKKSLSMLGFSADIFTGMFDDKEYLEQLKTEAAIEKAENRDEEIEIKRFEAIDYVTRNIEAIKNATSISEIKGLSKVSLRHLERQKLIKEIADICERGIVSIARAAEEKTVDMGIKNGSITSANR